MYLNDFDLARHEARHAVGLAFLTEPYGLTSPPIIDARIDRPVRNGAGTYLGAVGVDSMAIWDAVPHREAVRIMMIARALGPMGQVEEWPVAYDVARWLSGDLSLEGIPEGIVAGFGNGVALAPELYALWMNEARYMAADIIFRDAVSDVQRALVDRRVLTGVEVMDILRPHVPIWAASQMASAERRGV